MNQRGAHLIGPGADVALRHRGGDVLQCIHVGDSPAGCGHGPSCSACVVRNSVKAANAGGSPVHQRARMELRRDGQVSQVFMLVSASPFSSGPDSYVALVLEDLSEVVASSRVLPVCMRCKRVRREGTWEAMEEYLGTAMDLKVNHGLCPGCVVQMHPEFIDDAPPA